MRIASWNIEWMNDWFVGGNQVAFRASNDRVGITNVADLAQRVAAVIQAIAADVLTVQEGPSDPREMQLFVNQYLGGNYAVLGGLDGRSQKVYALVRSDGDFRNPALAEDTLTRAMEDPWEADVDGDEVLQHYEFTRRPLVVTGRDSEGHDWRVASLHTKSKYVHRGEQMWNDPMRRPQFIHEALVNRRRISSEATRTRQYLDDLLRVDQQARIVVTGDFNDGPGLDYFERRYLTHNVVDILLGSAFYPERIFAHAFIARVPEHERFTARFRDFVDEVPDRPLLLDHILTSPAIRDSVQDAGVLHEPYNQGTPNPNGSRQERVSDHRPVFVGF